MFTMFHFYSNIQHTTGDGPRNCIGMRLAQVNVKFTLATIVKNFTIEADSRLQYPIKVDPLSPAFTPEGGFLVKMKKIEA